jgi:hypothetical protein
LNPFWKGYVVIKLMGVLVMALTTVTVGDLVEQGDRCVASFREAAKFTSYSCS